LFQQKIEVLKEGGHIINRATLLGEIDNGGKRHGFKQQSKNDRYIISINKC